jgi:hypothetical protein
MHTSKSELGGSLVEEKYLISGWLAELPLGPARVHLLQGQKDMAKEVNLAVCLYCY